MNSSFMNMFAFFNSNAGFLSLVTAAKDNKFAHALEAVNKSL